MIRAVDPVDQEAADGLHKWDIKSSAPLMNDRARIEERKIPRGHCV